MRSWVSERRLRQKEQTLARHGYRHGHRHTMAGKDDGIRETRSRIDGRARGRGMLDGDGGGERETDAWQEA